MFGGVITLGGWVVLQSAIYTETQLTDMHNHISNGDYIGDSDNNHLPSDDINPGDD